MKSQYYDLNLKVCDMDMRVQQLENKFGELDKKLVDNNIALRKSQIESVKSTDNNMQYNIIVRNLKEDGAWETPSVSMQKGVLSKRRI